MNIPIISDIFKTIGDGVKSWNEGRVRIKEAKINAKVAKYEAEGKRYEMALSAETNWDLEALRQSQFSWKDEWFTVLLSAPFVGAFIPKVQDYVITGFNYISQTPDWYQWSFLGAVCASFGLRWWFSKK